MTKLNLLENNYPMDYREAFEALATHIFCVSLNLNEGVNRPVNKKGIESEPVKIGSKVYAYQAKYYDAATKLRDKKDELIDAVKEARRQGITDLLLFVNRNHTEDSRTGEKSAYLKDIESIAQGSGNDPVVNLEWWTLSKIEQTLDMPEYQYIKDIYLGKDGSDSPDFHSFYDNIVDYCENDSESALYGGMSLLDSYIEPTLEINDNNSKTFLSARTYLENFVESDSSIAVICGEPGHGKTSLCYKAMYDYYKNGWLAGKVSNVFRFSLNPANTNALANDSLYIYALLSWGDDRQNQVIKKNECRNALIFFDGFDELIEWYPKVTLETFIKNYIVQFQKNTGSHIIITSRTMAVEPEKTEYALRNNTHIPIIRMQPISSEKQYNWIENYIQHTRKANPAEADKIEEYYTEYRNLFTTQSADDNSMNSLLGIPIIFRMIVTARYLPKEGQSVTGIYNDLFEVSWERHRRKDDIDSSVVKADLAEHALQIFIDNNDTAEADISGYPSWLFSFYTTNEGKRRIGFLHRSFYQYFLAYEILSWFKYPGADNNADMKDRLSYLAARKLDKTTLLFITELYEQSTRKESIDISISRAYDILRDTDGILEAPHRISDALKVQAVSALTRAANVFCNVISIGGSCGEVLSAENVNEPGIKTYDLSGCILRYANLQDMHLERVKFANADLRQINLHKAGLSMAVLHDADLSGANLSEASLDGADLRRANLIETNLYRAWLQGADLHWAILGNAHLHKAYLGYAFLCLACFISADLSKANLRLAYLDGADLSQANLNGAFLFGANLHKARLCGTDLSRANLRRVSLFEADLSNANLRNADLTDCIIDDAYMFGADVEGTKVKKKAYDYIRKQDVKNLDKIIIIDENE